MVESFAAEYVDIISYQNAGGLGIEIENPDADAGTAALTFYLNFNEDRADIVNAAEIEFGTYYHVVVTFGAGKDHLTSIFLVRDDNNTKYNITQHYFLEFIKFISIYATIQHCCCFTRKNMLL